MKTAKYETQYQGITLANYAWTYMKTKKKVNYYFLNYFWFVFVGLFFFPSSFVLLSCGLMTIFSVVFGLLFLFCMSIVVFWFAILMTF